MGTHTTFAASRSTPKRHAIPAAEGPRSPSAAHAVGGSDTTAQQPPPLSGQVLTAALVLAAGVLPLLFALPHDRVAVDATMPMLGWLPVGIAGVVALDRRADSAVGWAAVVAATTPTFVIAWTVIQAGGDTSRDLDGLTSGIASGPLWLLPVVLIAAAAVFAGRTGGRPARRWQVWLVAAPVATLAAAAVVWQVGTSQAYGITATTGLMIVACVVAVSGFVDQPRPADEPLLDAALVLGVLATGAAVGWGVRWFATHERIFAADVVAAFAGAMSLILATPAAIWVRREVLTRRYGPGVLAPEDVAAITADLRRDGDPRQLLTKAATMVTATSGTTAARITLADPDDDLDDHRSTLSAEKPWREFPLLVGEEPVGVLAVRAATGDGLEARQERVVAQLAPTVALVARAVALAVEAEHARSDLSHEREAERNRILADLHDDLGPMLAGMSMRVGAAQQLTPTPALAALAEDLAAARSDLRRIVAGLTPSALSGQAADAAITRLVDSFRTDTGPDIELDGDVPADLGPETTVVVYRTVAEAVTNALRHADPSHVTVRIAHGTYLDDAAPLAVTVTDDGRGGVVVPGVGLTSLRSRAHDLGGTLDVSPAHPAGTVLTLTLPEVQR